MNILPRTLLGRTALYLGVLTVMSQTLWFVSAGYFLFRPLKENYIQYINAMVTMAQGLLEKRASDSDLLSGKTPVVLSYGMIRVVSDQEVRPAFTTDGEKSLSELTQTLQQRIAPSVLVQFQKDEPYLWVRFPAHESLFWVVLPISRPVIPYSLVGWVGIVLTISIGGAYLIVFRVTRQLRKVTKAAQAVGLGMPPDVLEEIGPQEIRDLGSGFNQMAENLKRIDADRRLMLAGISHDLRTPLTHLRIAVELAGTNAEQQIAEGMIGDIGEMDSILKQFLDYARDGSEEISEEGDLNAIVGEVCQRYQARGDAVEMQLRPITIFVFKKFAMRRVITNLVDNAVRYGGKGIRVETKTDGTKAEITVSDEGPGIRSGVPSDFIKPFAREDISRSEPGSGLGLAIVERIVVGHGGRLRLENGPSSGLIASVEIPLRRGAGSTLGY